MLLLGPADVGWPAALPATLHLGVLGYSANTGPTGGVGGAEMTIVAGPAASASSGNGSAALLVLGMPQRVLLRQGAHTRFRLTLPPDRTAGTLLLALTHLTGDDPDLYVSANGTAHPDGACDAGATCWSSAQLGDDVLQIPGAAAEARRALAPANPNPDPKPKPKP